MLTVFILHVLHSDISLPLSMLEIWPLIEKTFFANVSDSDVIFIGWPESNVSQGDIRQLYTSVLWLFLAALWSFQVFNMLPAVCAKRCPQHPLTFVISGGPVLCYLITEHLSPSERTEKDMEWEASRFKVTLCNWDSNLLLLYYWYIGTI